jgi:hypothetical protein
MTDQSEHDELVTLKALVKAADESKRVAIDEWGNQSDSEHYLIPRGLWDDLARKAQA